MEHRKKLLMESIAEIMDIGMLPHVPEALSLEQSLYPPKLHPRNASLQRELHAWASKLGPRHAKDVQHTIEISSLSCFFWPCTVDEPPRRMLTLLKLMYWFFLVEHEVDDCEAAISAEDKVLQADKAACRGALDALVGVSGGAAPVKEGSAGGGVPVIIAVALEWWAEMRADGMSLKQQARFVEEVTRYWQSRKLQRLLMSGGPAPNLEVYMPLSRSTAAGGPICMAAEYGLGIELDKEAVSSALILQLQDAVIDHAVWVNDIYSFPKEFAKGECLNLVYLLHARNNSAAAYNIAVPFHVAVSQAWQMVKARQLDCARLALEIAVSPRLASKPGLVRYAEALCLLTSGNWAWTLQVPRNNSGASVWARACAPSFKRTPTALKLPAANCVPVRLVTPTFRRGNALLAYHLPSRSVFSCQAPLSFA